MTETVFLYWDDAMILHNMGFGHPESPERLRAIREEIERAPLPGVRWVRPSPAPPEALERNHPADYVDEIARQDGHWCALDPDTSMSPGSKKAAWLAAGAGIDAVNALHEGATRRAFALVRPPGHHAESSRAMGFCLLNNIAVAAHHAVGALGYRRVLIVDWDVHHGNGTQHAFERRSDVLFFSTHRYPFYPGTGACREVGSGEGTGFTVNVPMGHGMGDGDFAATFERLLQPVAEAYAPDLVLVSAGFDCHRDDPLGGQRVTEEGFAHLCGVVRGIADRHAQGRIALFLEGGYDLDGLARSVRACVEVLAGAAPPGPQAPGRRGEESLSEAIAVQKHHWKALG